MAELYLAGHKELLVWMEDIDETVGGLLEDLEITIEDTEVVVEHVEEAVVEVVADLAKVVAEGVDS